MGIQEILVACLFLAALVYVGRLFYRSLRPDKSCGSNCKCGVDFSKIDVPAERK